MADAVRTSPKKVFKPLEHPKTPSPIKKKSAKFVPATPVNGNTTTNNIKVTPPSQPAARQVSQSAQQPVQRQASQPTQQATQQARQVSRSTSPQQTRQVSQTAQKPAQPVRQVSQSGLQVGQTVNKYIPKQPQAAQTPQMSQSQLQSVPVKQASTPSAPSQNKQKTPQAPQAPQTPNKVSQLQQAAPRVPSPAAAPAAAATKPVPAPMRKLKPVPVPESEPDQEKADTEYESQSEAQDSSFETAPEGHDDHPIEMNDLEDLDVPEEVNKTTESAQEEVPKTGEIGGDDEFTVEDITNAEDVSETETAKPAKSSAQALYNEALPNDSGIITNAPAADDVFGPDTKASVESTVDKGTPELETTSGATQSTDTNINGAAADATGIPPGTKGNTRADIPLPIKSISQKDFASGASNNVPNAGDATGVASEKLDKGKDVVNEIRYKDTLGKMPDLVIGLIGARVNEDAQIVDDNGNIVGAVEGDIPSMLGKTVSPSGEIFDDNGEVAGHVSENYTIDDPEEQAISLDDHGNVVDDDGNMVAELRGRIHEVPRDEPGSKAKTQAEAAAEAQDLLDKSDIHLDIKSTKDCIHLVIRIPTTFQRHQ